jgi:HEAT repeat protein
MLRSSIESFFDFLQGKGSRLSHFLGLAASIMALNVFTYTLASSLFITHAGADGLPVSYILIGLVAIPLYTGFSQILDRFSHIRFFQYLLLGGIVFVVFTRALLSLSNSLVYYIIYIGFYFQWTLHNDVLLPTLINDYFTSREYNRKIHYITMSQGIGGLLGGSLLSLLSHRFSTQDLLLGVPIFYGIAIAQFSYLKRSKDPVSKSISKSSNSPIENIKVLPMLWKRYPIVGFLVTSILLWIILYSLAEFQYYKIYEQAFHYDEKALTRFLGLFSAIGNIVQFVLLYFGTRFLLDRMGVVRMNLLYPLTTLIGFIGLALFPFFPTAIFLHFNNATLDNTINQPANELNYNAIPHNFMGRVRSLVNGVFYSLGVALSGVLLLIAKSTLSSTQTISLGIGLSAIFVGVRYWMGKSYLQSLLGLLRAGSVRWDEVSEGLTRLPNGYREQVRQLLQSSDRQNQLLGLKLAARIRHPSQFIAEIENLSSIADLELRRATIVLFSSATDRRVAQYLRQQLKSKTDVMRLIALESLLASKQSLSDEELRPLLQLDNPDIQVLACIAAEHGSSTDPTLRYACERLWHSPMDEQTQWVVVRGISFTGNRKLIPLLREILMNATPTVKKEALKSLVALNPVGNQALADLATSELDHPDREVRIAAIELLGKIRSLKHLEIITTRGLEDLNLDVRLKAAVACANYGDLSLPQLLPYLDAAKPEIVEAAISAIAQVQTRQAEQILWNHLKPDYDWVPNLVRWQKQMKLDTGEWRALKMAIDDYSQRLISKVLHVLSGLGHKRTIAYVRQMLTSEDARRRSNAIEALAALKHRRFIIPILPLLEFSEDDSSLKSEKIDPQTLLRELMHVSDRWLRIGAILTLAEQSQWAILKREWFDSEPDPVVRRFTRQIVMTFDILAKPDFEVTRVLFLKQTALFNLLSLDELLPINRAFKLHKFAKGDRIFTEGEIGTSLYIVYQGKIQMTRKNGSKPVVLSSFEERDSFCDSHLFEETKHLSSATAYSDSQLLILSRQNFLLLFDLYPKLLSCFGVDSKKQDIYQISDL